MNLLGFRRKIKGKFRMIPNSRRKRNEVKRPRVATENLIMGYAVTALRLLFLRGIGRLFSGESLKHDSQPFSQRSNP